MDSAPLPLSMADNARLNPAIQMGSASLHLLPAPAGNVECSTKPQATLPKIPGAAS